MRTLVLFGSLCVALASVGSACLGAARAFTEFIGLTLVGFVRSVAIFFAPLLVTDGRQLVPAIAGYRAPRDSYLRHESFVHERSAARGG